MARNISRSSSAGAAYCHLSLEKSGCNPRGFQTLHGCWSFKLGGNISLPPVPEAQPRTLNPPHESPSPAIVKRGEALYQSYCSACHGDVATSGGVLPDLRYSKMLADVQWLGIVIDGALKSAGMVSFSKELTRDDAEAIRSYVIFRANQSITEDKAGKN